MRVLLTNDLPVGPGSGVEVHVARLAAGLVEAGDDVELVAGEVTHHGVRKVLDLWDPWARELIARRARAFGADVIHHHNVLRELSVAVLGAVPEIPTVVTIHDRRVLGRQPENPGLRGFVDRHVKVPFDRSVLRRTADTVIAVSDGMEVELRAAGFPHVVHVPQPVEQPHHAPRAVGACRDVVFVGRLTHEKGPDVAVDAFLQLADDHPESQLVVIGDGPARTAIERRTEGDARIEVTGGLGAAALSDRLGRARLVVLPSRWAETGPLVALEAAAHGRPLVTSDVEGLRQLVQGLGAGLTVPSGAVGDFTGAMRRLLDDGVFAETLGEAGRLAVLERHALPVVIDRLRTLYRSLAARRG